MKQIDLYIIRSFLVNCALALGVMIGMYVLLDLIVNFNLFASDVAPQKMGAWEAFWSLVGQIMNFYMYRSLVIFQMVSGIIPLLAAGFTMVRMTRHHELTALMASGISLYRIAAPIIICSVGFNLLVVVDQELLMPNCIDQLLLQQGQTVASFQQHEPVYFLPESDNSLVLATSYDPKTQTLTDVRIIQRDADGVPTGRILADKAVWNNNVGEGPESGGWVMTNVVRINDKNGANPNEIPEPLASEIYTTPLNPSQLNLIFRKQAVDYLSTYDVTQLMLNSPPVTRIALEKILHTRITQLIMNMIMLLIGIPFLLTREPNALVRNMFWCGAISAACFISTFVFNQLAGSTLSPFVGAWLPVVIFGPLALVMLDMLKT
ncbi:MAG TPA: LptF/LptG family permease [Phycisphaerae bacterium]|nr:LptF/LptG family permease [Phycisphaerae bacterium]